MPSVCSRAQRLVGLGTALSISVAASVMAARAEVRWRQGVFPVASFAGYTSHFGSRRGPSGSMKPHHGLDIAAPLGSPIRNWWHGAVREVISDGACGLGLVIQSGAYEHFYCPLAGSLQGWVFRC